MIKKTLLNIISFTLIGFGLYSSVVLNYGTYGSIIFFCGIAILFRNRK